MASKPISHLSSRPSPGVVNQSFQKSVNPVMNRIEIRSLSSNSDIMVPINPTKVEAAPTQSPEMEMNESKIKNVKAEHRRGDSVIDWINCSNNEMERLIKENEDLSMIKKKESNRDEEGKRLTTEEINFIFE